MSDFSVMDHYRMKLGNARSCLRFAVECRARAADWHDNAAKKRGWRKRMRCRALEWRAAMKLVPGARPPFVPAEICRLEAQARKEVAA